MGKKKPKTYSAQYKFTVVLEVIRVHPLSLTPKRPRHGSRAPLALGFATLVWSLVCGCHENTTAPLENPPDTTPSEDPWDTWVVQNSHPLTSVTSDDYSDLQFLKDVIGDRRLVQLGESGHGVSEFNQVKVRLIKFFHQEMGFEVIAFESDLFGCFHADQTAGSLSDLQFMYNCIYGVWHTREVAPLFQFIQETKGTDQPLTLAGIDMKPSSHRIRGARPAFMEEVVASVNPIYATDVRALEEKMETASYAPFGIDSLAVLAGTFKEEYRELYDFLEGNEPALLAAFPGDRFPPLVAQQVAHYSQHTLEFARLWRWGGCSAKEVRDFGMAENASFLADRLFPDKKILIWAHNSHIRHHGQTVKTRGDSCPSMGRYLKARHRSELYTVGLYMYEGTAAWNDRSVYVIRPASPNSLEELLHRAGKPILFLDLLHRSATDSPPWFNSEVNSRAWGTQYERIIPRDQYDGLLYLETVTPPAYIY